MKVKWQLNVAKSYQYWEKVCDGSQKKFWSTSAKFRGKRDTWKLQLEIGQQFHKSFCLLNDLCNRCVTENTYSLCLRRRYRWNGVVHSLTKYCEGGWLSTWITWNCCDFNVFELLWVGKLAISQDIHDEPLDFVCMTGWNFEKGDSQIERGVVVWKLTESLTTGINDDILFHIAPHHLILKRSPKIISIRCRGHCLHSFHIPSLPITSLLFLLLGLLRMNLNFRGLRRELFEYNEMNELTHFKPEPRASPISQPAR
jgi:hypothetical protein